MSEHRTHLALHDRSACGMGSLLTRRPEDVNCGSCQRTLAMADAEARQQQQRKRG